MMRAAFLMKTREVAFKEIPIPEPEDDEALVKIQSVGICGSDIHYYMHGRIGSFVIEKPLILGHESAGEVVHVGKKVRNVRVGDRVAMEPGIPCRRCFYCRTGNYNLCKDVVFFATPPVNGTFCEYVTHPTDYLFPLPENMSYDEGAMIEPLSVGLYACKLANLRPGDSVTVLGAGPIGLVTLQAAKAMGASRIIVSDIYPKRLDFAMKLGAHHALNAKEVEVVQAVLDLTGGFGTDVVFEAAGSEQTTRASVKIVRNGGSIVWTGMAAKGDFVIPVSEAIAKEVRISGQFRYANTYPMAIQLVSQGRIDVKSMITKIFSFDEIAQALENWARGNLDHIKAIVRM
jgi:L-iditol 2-dehydrogenase